MIGGFVSAKKDFYSRVLRKSNEHDGFIYRLESMFILSKSKGSWIRSAGITENRN